MWKHESTVCSNKNVFIKISYKLHLAQGLYPTNPSVGWLKVNGCWNTMNYQFMEVWHWRGTYIIAHNSTGVSAWGQGHSFPYSHQPPPLVLVDTSPVLHWPSSWPWIKHHYVGVELGFLRVCWGQVVQSKGVMRKEISSGEAWPLGNRRWARDEQIEHHCSRLDSHPFREGEHPWRDSLGLWSSLATPTSALASPFLSSHINI